jgi:dTDP-4-dehydrorhamnose reductase
LIIGASGFIGRYLGRRLAQFSGPAGGYDVTGTYRSTATASETSAGAGISWRRAEVTDPAGLGRLFEETNPEVVALLAAVADVMTAEREPERATKVNAGGAARVAALCAQYQSRLILLSTEYVFDHERGNYGEEDPTRPKFHYGYTKLAAEGEVARLAPQWSVIRTSLVYGWPIPGRRNMATVIRDRLRDGDAFDGHTNVYRTPIYVDHLVDGIVRLIEEYYPGIHHVAGGDWISMHQFAQEVAVAFGLDQRLVAATQAVWELPESDGPAATVSDPGSDLLGLDCTLTMRRLGLRAYGMAEGLQEMRERGGSPF